MKPLFLLPLVLGGLITGCGKEKPTPQPVAKPPLQVTQPTPSTTPPTPVTGYTAPPAVIGNDGMPSQQTFYHAIQKYMNEHQGRAAKDVNELVEKGYLPALPPPPPGKRYELDQRFNILKVVNQ